MRRLIVGAVTMAILTAGCTSSADDRTPPQLMSYDQMTQEYKKKVETYPNPLPKGISFPAAPRRPAEPTVYEKGEGVVTADEFWICAWIGEWLKNYAKNPRSAVVAMNWIDKADDTEFHREHYSDPNSVWHNEIVGPAKLGNSTTLREYYQNGCAERDGLGPIG